VTVDSDIVKVLKMPRIFDYTDCYVLSAWRSPTSLYPTCDTTS
jgi:hypothetical protein